jgi:outer membrane protein assembly factor BamD
MRTFPLVLLLLAAATVLLASCDPCRKLAKSDSIAKKDSAAYCYYERERYESAAGLFDELMGYYAASDRGEEMHYMFAKSNMKMGKLLTAAYYFRQYAQRYPNGKYLKAARFKVAKCYDLQSNNYELDQDETEKAIEFYNLYLKKYPESELASKAEERISKLRERLAHKAYSHANLFYKMEDYRAAVVTFQNVLSDYPDSKYREEAQYKLFMAAVEWADLSVREKQIERYREAKEFYHRFIEKYPNSEFIRKAEKTYKHVQDQLAQLETTKAE